MASSQDTVGLLTLCQRKQGPLTRTVLRIAAIEMLVKHCLKRDTAKNARQGNEKTGSDLRVNLHRRRLCSRPQSFR